jgi:uncharacterized membrane protein YpjA
MDKHSPLFWPIILLNIAAVFVGAYFYSDQLAATVPQLLIFVPDCPLYVLLSIIIIFGIIRSETLSFIASVGMVKYGLWTVFALLFHWDFYFQQLFFWTSVIFIVGHIGMALEGLALLPQKQSRLALALALAWFLLNDCSDYWLGTVPSLPPGGLETVRTLTVASSIAIPALLFAFAAQLRALAPVAWLRRQLAIHI